MTNNNFINIEECPKNKPAKFFYPDGTLIVETDNDLMFDYIRVRIKQEQIHGCYIEFEGHKILIDSNGDLSDYPDGFFTAHMDLLFELI